MITLFLSPMEMCLLKVSLFMQVNLGKSIFLRNYLCYRDFQIYLHRLFQVNAIFKNVSCLIFYSMLSHFLLDRSSVSSSARWSLLHKAVMKIQLDNGHKAVNAVLAAQ